MEITAPKKEIKESFWKSALGLGLFILLMGSMCDWSHVFGINLLIIVGIIFGAIALFWLGALLLGILGWFFESGLATWIAIGFCIAAGFSLFKAIF